MGESGSGKSALLSQVVSSGCLFKRVLWLIAGQLSQSSQAELAGAFGLRHTVPELIANSSLRDGALVLDGFEQFEGDARQRALELIRALNDEGFVGWKLVITCQPQSRESTLDALIEAGISGAHTVDFEKPSLHEVNRAVQHLPGIRALLWRSELQPILRNLVFLDWVLRAQVAQRFSTAGRPWVGETELINCIWERWIGDTAMRLARDSLLRTLGGEEGEKLSGAVHIDCIPHDLLPLLGSLANEGLIRTSGPSVQFSHDLMGDWARFRILLFAGSSAIQNIKDKVHVPRWGRAIRLYAQSIAEQGQGLDQWKFVTAQLAEDEPEAQLPGDFFLDGLLFAANSESLLAGGE